MRPDSRRDTQAREQIAAVVLVAILAVIGIGFAMVWWLRFVDGLAQAVK